MITVYKIINTQNNKIYFGITRTSLQKRFSSHIYSSKSKNTPLYAAIRKYGLDKFSIIPILYCDSWEYACELEKGLIKTHTNIYNLASGGEGGFCIPNIEAWKKKLSIKRIGRRPALGMKHSQENKSYFSGCGKRRWDIYGRYDKDQILKLGFTEANKEYGISKTHYYRLRNKSNDLV